MMIGVDYHPSFQQIAFLLEETGEYSERRLNHSDGEAEKFYRDLRLRGVHVRVGMEATGYSRWFERLLAELGFEVWIGDPAEIQARRVKRQETDRKDAQLLLKLMMEDRFPRIWVTVFGKSRCASTAVAPASAGADAHANHESAAGSGDERGPALEIQTVERTRASGTGEAGVGFLGPSAPTRVVGRAGPTNPTIEELTAAAEQEARKRPEALRLMTYPVWGRLTALAYVLIIGTRADFIVASRSATTWG